jgi:outer membrane cobalamin receptor
MKQIIQTIFLFFLSTALMAQKPVVSGRISDAATGEPLTGVNIFYSNEHGVASDADGYYSITCETGRVRLQYRFVGYGTEIRVLDLHKGEQLTVNVQMSEQTHMLNELVVSASRYEQKISDVIVSMEVINSAQVENTHTLSVESALQQVPGVMFLGDQVSIRSGNGYSYGVGSRVMLLLDDLPMLTGAGGEAKWDFVPLENLSQIEILKGASSALYGSSALNGVINIRTAYPGENPETNVLLYSGLYGKPNREEIAWWGDTQPYYSGIRLNHSRRIGNFDLVAGANVFSDKGYRENENEQYIRMNLNTRYRSKNISGLSGGINSNAMFNKGGNFLLWLDGDSGVYRASPVYDQAFENTRFNLDPHVTYYTENDSRHTLKGRLFQVTYDSDSRHNYDDSYFAEYQYLKRFENNFSITTGASATYIQSHSNLFGNVKHTANNHSVYFQADKRYRQWGFTLGGRYEWHKINATQLESKPLLRAGVNYQAGTYTFLRTSFGQGFRYPAIAEKYAATEVGALKIFPNDTLRPEYGWNTEIGVKQGFSIGRIQGYADVAVFWSEYEDMIEFTFGQHYPDSITSPTFNDFIRYTGFKAYNISNARIAGLETSFTGQGKSGPFTYMFTVGYTYTDPIDKDFRKREVNTATTDKNILKYRFYHSAKLGADVSFRNFSTGMNIDYHSYMINIDLAFEDSLRVNGIGLPIFILPGMREYREKNDKGDVLFNWRFAWEASTIIRLSFYINNLFNREYMTRPADVGPPRTFAVQLALRL